MHYMYVPITWKIILINMFFSSSSAKLSAYMGFRTVALTSPANALHFVPMLSNVIII